MFSLSPAVFLRVCFAKAERESAGRGWMAPDWDVCMDRYVAGPGHEVADEENPQTVSCWAGHEPCLALAYNPSANAGPGPY